MPKVFVSILNYNGSKDTLLCLKSLNDVNVDGFIFSVVTVDNGSKEEFKVNPSDYKNFELKLIRNKVNLGFSGGHNVGIKYALQKGADFVVILNNDVILDKNILIELLRTFTEKKDCGLVSPKIYFAKGHEFHKERYTKENLGKVFWYAGGIIDWKNVLASHRGVDEVDNRQYEDLEKTDFASGCCIMVKKEVFDRIGIFDEKYFLYFEDNDLNQRAKRAGFGIYYQPKAMLWHNNAGSTGGSGSTLHDYYITRNRLIFGFKYAPFRAKFALFRESLRLLIFGRKWQKIGAADFYLRRFGKGSYV